MPTEVCGAGTPYLQQQPSRQQQQIVSVTQQSAETSSFRSTSSTPTIAAVTTSSSTSVVQCKNSIMLNSSDLYPLSSSTAGDAFGISLLSSVNKVSESSASSKVATENTSSSLLNSLAGSSPACSSSSSSTSSCSTATALPPPPPSTIQQTLTSNLNNSEAGVPYSSSHLFLNGCQPNSMNVSSPQSLTEDPRTLQLALELSMVSLNDTSTAGGSCVQKQQPHTLPHLSNLQHNIMQQKSHHQMTDEEAATCMFNHTTAISNQQQQQHCQFDLTTLNALSAAVAAAASAAAASGNTGQCRGELHCNNNTTSTVNNLNNGVFDQFNTLLTVSNMLPPTTEDRSKKSQNMTECVPVPSSEHVAEIVGRQGCKIKALRAKTNTYIKTPVRGEEPVFVVTGRKEDVAKAKREILSAAEHFSLIRATRRPLSEGGSNLGNVGTCGITASGKTPLGPPAIAGQITIQVRVPYRVVGLVVGPKGATIKHIQQETQTYIVTPSREKEPIFQVTGLPDNVQSARKQIEAHIALRTGNSQNGTAANADPTVGVHTINSLSQILNEEINPEVLASLYKNGLCNTFEYMENNSAEKSVTSDINCMDNNILNAMLIGDNHTPNSSHLPFDTANGMNNFHNQDLDFINNTVKNCSMPFETMDNKVQDARTSNIKLQLNNHEGTVQTVGNHIVTFNSAEQQLNQFNSKHSILGVSGGNNTVQNGCASAASANGMIRSCSSASSTTSSKSANNSGGSNSSANSSRPELLGIWKDLSESLDVDEGIGDSPNIWTLPTLSTVSRTHCSPATSISPTDSLLGEASYISNNSNNLTHHLMAHHQREAASTATNQTQSLPQPPVQSQNQQLTTAGNLNLSPSMRNRECCVVCAEKAVTAALVPCGHTIFCMECASHLYATGENSCPVCNRTVYNTVCIQN